MVVILTLHNAVETINHFHIPVSFNPHKNSMRWILTLLHWQKRRLKHRCVKEMVPVLRDSMSQLAVRFPSGLTGAKPFYVLKSVSKIESSTGNCRWKGECKCSP